MKSHTDYCYTNILRWDILSRFSINNVFLLPVINKVSLRLQEKQPKHYKNRHILALFLELCSGQRVSPIIIAKCTYKNRIAPQKTSKTNIQVTLSLRKHNLFYFLDRFSFILQKAAISSRVTNRIVYDNMGGSALIFKEYNKLPELLNINAFVYKTTSLELYFAYQHSTKTITTYIQQALRIAMSTEGPVVESKHPVFNFITKSD